jgi:hypothetical protein
MTERAECHVVIYILYRYVDRFSGFSGSPDSRSVTCFTWNPHSFEVKVSYIKTNYTHLNDQVDNRGFKIDSIALDVLVGLQTVIHVWIQSRASMSGYHNPTHFEVYRRFSRKGILEVQDQFDLHFHYINA